MFPLITSVLGANAACTSTTSSSPPVDTTQPPGEFVRSDKPRLTAAAPVEDTHQLANDNAAFGFDVLRKGATTDNFVASAHSLSLALAMTYAGARGDTATEMAHALRFTLPDDRLHRAFGSLDLELASRAQKPVDSGKAFTLDVTNALFAQRGYTFLPAYLDLLAVNYGAGLSLLDFVADPEGARTSINGWVSDRTAQRIPELIPQGVVTRETVLVLTNTIYFKASWEIPFDAKNTANGDFAKLDGTKSNVAFMHQTAEHRYAEVDGFHALELRYVGDDVSMLLILPNEGHYDEVRQSFDGVRLAETITALGARMVDVTVPKFSFRSRLPAKQVLTSLGMRAAFEPGTADFSGMDGTRTLFIQDVVHEAFVGVDEIGTEAAGATAVVVGRVSMPERATFAATRPFFFFVRDEPTGAVLFEGQVTSP